jgi:hypothetical protein
MAFPDAGVLGDADITRGEFRTAIEDFLAATKAITISGKQLFTASGTFTVPAGVTTVYARVVGGGSGGGGSWHTGDTDTAANGSNGAVSQVARSGSVLAVSAACTFGYRGTSAAAGLQGVYSHTGGASNGGNCSLLRPYGAGGAGGAGLTGWNRGGGGGASEGVFAAIAVTAGQVLDITVGAGGAGGAGSPTGFAGAAGTGGAVLLEW